MKGTEIIGISVITIFIAVMTLIIIALTQRTTVKPFVFSGPSPEARALNDALVSLGGTEEMFDCSNYLAAVGSDFLDRQRARLCVPLGPIFSDVISDCICSSGTPESTGDQEETIRAALEDLGYPFQTINNQTIRVPNAPFNVTMCRDALCAGSACPDLLAMQHAICDKDGDPRYNSNTAKCVCLDAPPKTPIPCTPHEAVPLVFDSNPSSSAGMLMIVQSTNHIVLNASIPGRCIRQPRIYIGATRSIDNPPYPQLPGSFPTDTYPIQINIINADTSNPVGFEIAQTGEQPPEWNHPDAPTFECGHLLYLRWSALSKPKLTNGNCPSSATTIDWEDIRIEPEQATYRLCCTPP